jgi:hypothetical protein
MSQTWQGLTAMIVALLPPKPQEKLYSSQFIDNSLKPNIDSKIELTPDLEPLRPLIISQPEVFAPNISNLGNINLKLTKIVIKKKES